MCISSLIHSKQAHLCQLLKKSFFPPPTLLYPLGNIYCVFSTLACHQMSSVFGGGGLWGGGSFLFQQGCLLWQYIYICGVEEEKECWLLQRKHLHPLTCLLYLCVRKKQTTSAKEQLISNILLPSSYWLVHFKALCIPNATCSSLQRAFSTLMGMMVLIALSQCEHFVFFPLLSLSHLNLNIH